MRTKLLALFILSGFIFASCDKEDDSMKFKGPQAKFKGEEDIEIKAMQSTSGTTEVRLLAGQHIEVGKVTVTNDDDYLYVTYSTEGFGWTMTETHLHVGNTKGDFPLSGNNNPAPGRFDFSGNHDFVSEVTYTIEKSELPELMANGLYYIAAHAVVNGGETSEDLDGFAEILPETATVSVKYPQTGGQAYFPEVYVSNASFLDGTYQGWCIETAFPISQTPTEYEAGVFSSYEEFVGTQTDYPESFFNKINWILNQSFIGKDSESGGTFTYGDVQRAIWTILDDGFPPSNADGLRVWSQARVDEIIALGEAAGFENFRPGCGDIFAVIFEIQGSQNVIIEFPVPCKSDGDETAWGEGVRFTERGNWAMWFVHSWNY